MFRIGDAVMLRPVALMDPGVLAYGADDMYVLQTLFADGGNDTYQAWYGWITDYIDWDKKVWLPKPVRLYAVNHNRVAIIPPDAPWDGGGLWSAWRGNHYWLIGMAALEPMPPITQTRRLTVKRERESKCST